ncbi:MAG: T9SS type A sorting domain-containing protein [Fidelibacterota bacterium]
MKGKALSIPVRSVCKNSRKMRVLNRGPVSFCIAAALTLSAFLNTSSASQIGVASGKATIDGRPLVWKTRDYISRPNNEVYYNTNYKYKFISIVNAGGTWAWMGVNEKGFAILNSNAEDLPSGSSGLSNGPFMRYALGNCATVADLERLLDSTNVTGRQTHANFGAIDSTGAAAIFETGGNQYWKFDANDSSQAPDGWIVRTNFAVNGGGSAGIERYRRSVKLISDFYSGDSLNYRSIIRSQMRDFSDFESNPVPVPYPHQWRPDRPFGYIYTYVSLCRSTSVSAVAIQGVLPGESARLSTMWTLLGQPASTIAVPYWPVGKPPAEANGNPTAPLCDVSIKIRSLLFDYEDNSHYIDSYKLLDGLGGGLWTQTFPVEDSIFTAAETVLEQWRRDIPPAGLMLETEASFARYALSSLQQAYEVMSTSITTAPAEAVITDPVLRQNYPNPFNTRTVIGIDLPRRSKVKLAVYNLLGREIATLVNENMNAGSYSISWDGTDDRGEAVASGIYLYKLESKDRIQTRKLLLMK